MSNEEQAIQDVSEDLIRDVILSDIDLTSLDFVAIECLKESAMVSLLLFFIHNLLVLVQFQVFAEYLK